MRIDAGKHLRQVYTGRYRRIHQHELFQSQEIIQAFEDFNQGKFGEIPVQHQVG